MILLVLFLATLYMVHIGGASLLAFILAVSAAFLTGIRISSPPASDVEHKTPTQRNLKCDECGLNILGRACCGDHPAVGG